MKNNFIKRLLTVCLAALLLATLVAGCGGKGGSEPATILSDCTVKVQTEGGLGIANIGVTVYSDSSKADLIDFVRTDADGVAKFNADIPSGSAIFLTDVADGYAVEEYYTLKEKETIISLKAQLKSEMAPIQLGGVMFDFTVTDQNGIEHTLSKLLESKKAVMINLWYTTCGPCKMEFPYLQQAYNEYKDDIGLLALSPMDSAAAVASFAAENGLTFPMASCDSAWDGLVAGIAYPTTIIVDRFGTVSLIHIGWVDKTSTFKNLFEHFIADDYKQGTFTDLSSFEGEDEPIGTAANPYVHSGSEGFSVEVEPAQTVYYTLYGVDGLEATVSGSSLKFTCNEQEYTPSNGKIAFTIHASKDATAVPMVFTNTGSTKATYKVSFTAPVGSVSNPATMKDGSVTVKLEEGNSRGMYYQYKAPYEGTFTLECKNTVNYTVTITNLDGNETAALDKNTKKATINVRKNDKIQIVVTAVEKDGKYPATEAQLNASCKKEEVPVTPPTGTTSTLNTNGKLINPDEPIEYGSVLNFDAKINAGEMVLFHVFRVGGTTLRIADPSAYVIYNDKTYTPDKNGYVYVPVTTESNYVPVVLKIGNGGKENKTYAVKFSFPEGSAMNPYDAVAGNVKTNIAADNAQGVYYQCTVEKDGKFTIKLKSVSSSVKCDIRVTVVDTSYIPQQYLLSETSDGKTLTIEVYEGDEIEINFVALPDENYKYPAATIESEISFS